MQELTDILEKAWLRLVSITEMGSMVDRQIDSTQEDFNFERPACKEVDDASVVIDYGQTCLTYKVNKMG